MERRPTLPIVSSTPLSRKPRRESLLRRTRQEYHERIAHVLIEQFPNTSATRPEMIAQHLTKGGLAVRAIPFWAQAAKSAMQRSANLEAISHLTIALELVDSLPQTEHRKHQETYPSRAASNSAHVDQGLGRAGGWHPLSARVRTLEQIRRHAQAVPDARRRTDLLSCTWPIRDGL